jgi:hypothetical protein
MSGALTLTGLEGRGFASDLPGVPIVNIVSAGLCG